MTFFLRVSWRKLVGLQLPLVALQKGYLLRWVDSDAARVRSETLGVVAQPRGEVVQLITDLVASVGAVVLGRVAVPARSGRTRSAVSAGSGRELFALQSERRSLRLLIV